MVLSPPPPLPPQPEPSPDTFYKYTIQHVEREEGLIDHRISWMLTSQGFLFTALALLSNTNGKSPAFAALYVMTPFVGLMVAILILLGIHAAHLSIGNLLSSEKRPERWSLFPDITTPTASWMGRLCGYGLPLLFIVIWLIYLSQSAWFQRFWPFG